MMKIDEISFAALRPAEREQASDPPDVFEDRVKECVVAQTWNREGYECIMAATNEEELDECFLID
jgi:hypothetical protein